MTEKSGSEHGAVAYVSGRAKRPGKTSREHAEPRAHPFPTIALALAALATAKRLSDV